MPGGLERKKGSKKVARPSQSTWCNCDMLSFWKDPYGENSVWKSRSVHDDLQVGNDVHRTHDGSRPSSAWPAINYENGTSSRATHHSHAAETPSDSDPRRSRPIR